MRKIGVLVTGGAGYIGSHVVKALCESEKYYPIIIDDFSTNHLNWYGKTGIYNQSSYWYEILDIEIQSIGLYALRRWKEKYNIQACVHLAAFSDVSESMRDPSKYYKNNIANSITFLSQLVEVGIDKIVFSSSASVYGTDSSKVPISETVETNPRSPYAESKRVVERYLEALQCNGQCKSINLRYFNAAGNHPDCQLGEVHRPETHLIPKLVHNALYTPSEVFEVYGNDYSNKRSFYNKDCTSLGDLKDRSAIRDYVHVVDLALAHKKALDYLLNDKNPLRNQWNFNIGAGKGFSVLEVLDTVNLVLNTKIKFEIKSRRKGDIGFLIADIGLAGQELKWKPTHRSNLQNIICDVANFQKSPAYKPFI